MFSIPPVDKRNASVIASLARANQRSTDASPIKQVFIIFSSVRTVDSILHPGKKDRRLEMYFLERLEEDKPASPRSHGRILLRMDAIRSRRSVFTLLTQPGFSFLSLPTQGRTADKGCPRNLVGVTFDSRILTSRAEADALISPCLELLEFPLTLAHTLQACDQINASWSASSRTIRR